MTLSIGSTLLACSLCHVHLVQVASGEKTLALRRVGCQDQGAGKCFDFLTNHMRLLARTIADSCKERWPIRRFFRFIKQDLKVKSFLGNLMKTVLFQVCETLIAYLLQACQKFMSKIDVSLHSLAMVVQQNLFQQCISSPR